MPARVARFRATSAPVLSSSRTQPRGLATSVPGVVEAVPCEDWYGA